MRKLVTDKASFQAMFSVSADEMADFQRYADLLIKWQAVKNLVASSTLSQIWGRHFADSYQLVRLCSRACNWMDLGSGAGFPGLVIAMALKHKMRKADRQRRVNTKEPAYQGSTTERESLHYKVALIEANGRKCAFLKNVSRETLAPVHIIQQRIEELNIQDLPFLPDVITARALAPLSQLLPLLMRLVGPNTVALIHKGQDFGLEIKNASKYWNFDVKQFPSHVDETGVILELSNIKSRDAVD